jgi:hypothetical protein
MAEPGHWGSVVICPLSSPSPFQYGKIWFRGNSGRCDRPNLASSPADPMNASIPPRIRDISPIQPRAQLTHPQVGGNCSPTRTAVSADISEQLQALPRGGGEVGFAADGEAIQFDVFGIASSRTMFLPAPPAGKVTVQLLATAVNAGIPGDFRFYFAAPASVASSASTSVMTS